jgi:outer membrane protein TolC
MAGVSLNVPLQRETRSGALDEARAMEMAAHHEVEGMTDAARAEIAVALRRRAAAVQAVTLYEQRLLPVARDRIEAARAGLVTSQSSFMTVIQAEHDLRAAELELEMARADLSRRSAELDVALGRLPGIDAREAKP